MTRLREELKADRYLLQISNRENVANIDHNQLYVKTHHTFEFHLTKQGNMTVAFYQDYFQGAIERVTNYVSPF